MGAGGEHSGARERARAALAKQLLLEQESRGHSSPGRGIRGSRARWAAEEGPRGAGLGRASAGPPSGGLRRAHAAGAGRRSGESPLLGQAGGGCGAERGAHSSLAGRPALMSFPHGPKFPARHDHTGKTLPRPPPPQLPPSHREGRGVGSAAGWGARRPLLGVVGWGGSLGRSARSGARPAGPAATRGGREAGRERPWCQGPVGRRPLPVLPGGKGVRASAPAGIARAWGSLPSPLCPDPRVQSGGGQLGDCGASRGGPGRDSWNRPHPAPHSQPQQGPSLVGQGEPSSSTQPYHHPEAGPGPLGETEATRAAHPELPVCWGKLAVVPPSWAQRR